MLALIKTELVKYVNYLCFIKPFLDVHGQWCKWRLWGSCSTTCGPGTEQWGRQCNCPAPGPGGMNCPGFHTKIEECHNQRCPGINGGWLCLQGVNKRTINSQGLEITYNSILFESILNTLTNLLWNLISYPIEVNRSGSMFLHLRANSKYGMYRE